MSSASSSKPATISFLLKIHDGLTAVGFALAGAALGLMAVAYCYEVAARYFFGAPTVWASPLVSYVLCAMIFLALPELTRRSLHIVINLLDGHLSQGVLRCLDGVVRILGVVACLAVAWIGLVAAMKEYDMGIYTNAYVAIPKWWLTALVPYGMAGSALYLLRQLFGEQMPTEELMS
jgi:TRAP-type C4-dicarboxylate transport system permease small subunit